MNKCEQQIIQVLCTNKSYVYELTGCVWDVYGLILGKWNDKNYIGMLKKVNYAICWFLMLCAFLQYVANFINSCVCQYLTDI